jgi:hypothetical protein
LHSSALTTVRAIVPIPFLKQSIPSIMCTKNPPASLIEPYRTFREVRSNILSLLRCETGHSPPFPLPSLRMCELYPHSLIRLHGPMIHEAYAQV